MLLESLFVNSKLDGSMLLHDIIGPLVQKEYASC